MRQAKLGDFLAKRSRGIVPASTPDETFELYSVPAFDGKRPEVLTGGQIGSNKQMVDPGTVLLCKINPRINRAWTVGSFTDHQKIASTEWITFPPHPDVEPRYLAHYLSRKQIRDYLAANASGVGGSLMRVKASTVEDLPLPLPSVAEQRGIVAEIEKQFSRLDEAVANLKRVKANLNSYERTSLQVAFNASGPDLMARMIDVCEVVSGYAFRSEDFTSAGVPVVKIANIGYGEFVWKDQEYLPTEYLTRYKAFEVRPGDLLIALTRPVTEGTLKVCQYPHNAPKGLLNQRVALLRTQAKCDSIYLLAQLRSPGFMRLVLKAVSQTLQPNLSPLDMKEFEIFWPEPEYRREIVAEVDRRLSIVGEVEAELAVNLKRAQVLRQAVLSGIFSP